MAKIKIPPHLTPYGDAPDERVYLVKRQFHLNTIILLPLLSIFFTTDRTQGYVEILTSDEETAEIQL